MSLIVQTDPTMSKLKINQRCLPLTHTFLKLFYSWWISSHLWQEVPIHLARCWRGADRESRPPDRARWRTLSQDQCQGKYQSPLNFCFNIMYYIYLGTRWKPRSRQSWVVQFEGLLFRVRAHLRCLWLLGDARVAGFEPIVRRLPHYAHQVV